MHDEIPEPPSNRPVIRRGFFTFVISGPCIYCGKKAERQRTFDATDVYDANDQANRAKEHLCHRKCGGY